MLESAVTGKRTAFDAMAADYDLREADNPVMRLMRKRSLEILERTFPQRARLLDVGCGTGTEAIWLTQRGRIVFGVDLSPQMLDALAHRAAALDVQVPTRLLGAGDLTQLVDDAGEASFDGAYSSFGPLNAEPSLGPPLHALSRLVRPRGRIVLSVMNRWCVAEMAAMAAGGRVHDALRRARASVRVTVGTASIEVRYPSWRQLNNALRPEFRVLSVLALPLLLLPYAWPALASRPRLLAALCRLDGIMAPRPPFAWLGDHLLVVAERRDGAARRAVTLDADES